MILKARDALTEVARVFEEDRPPTGQHTAHLYAVFAQPHSDGALALQDERFLGLVTDQDIARHPGRIFADLLPRHPMEPVSPDTEIEEVLARLDAQCLYALPVLDEAGNLAGAVTCTSVLGAYFHQVGERHAVGDRLEAEIERDHIRLATGNAQREEALKQERAAAEAEMRKLARVIEQTADSVLITDAEGVIQYVNPGYEQATGYSRAEAVGRKPNLVKSGQHDAAFYQRLWETILRGEVFRGVLVNRRKDGSLYYEEKTITPLRDERGKITHFVSTGEDITERIAAERAVRESEECFRATFMQAAVGIVVADPEGRLQRVNPRFCDILGYAPEEILGRHFQDFTHPEDREKSAHQVARLLAGERADTTFATRCLRKDGATVWGNVGLSLVRDEHGTPQYFIAIIEDITARMQAEAQLSYLAFHDALTGLPNRTLLLDRLQQALIEADRVNRVVAVLFFDLDHFKIINDTLGHHVGDGLLLAVAERLKTCVRPGDTVARLGGDEFAIVLTNVAQADDVAPVARKILAAFERPFRVGERELHTTTSMGIALYPHDVRDADSLLKNADAAMYHAKDSGRNTFQFFTAELNMRAERRLAVESALRQALARGELSLHYQPQVDLKTGRITGVEALARWRHPELGNVPPAEFILVAEETGLIVSIGEWVLREACRQIKQWHETGFSKLQVAVNISGKQLRRKDFTDRVREILHETGLDARYLNLELTESLLMADADEVLSTMHGLHDLGIGFSVDDFGTGYSSLAYLKRFPIDILKIDRTFVHDLATDPNDVAIVKTIIAMAHTLGMRVVAEGVETREQLEFLSRQGCDGMQGYYCGEPVPAATFTELLQDWKRLRAGRCRAISGRPVKERRSARRPRG